MLCVCHHVKYLLVLKLEFDLVFILLIDPIHVYESFRHNKHNTDTFGEIVIAVDCFLWLAGLSSRC